MTIETDIQAALINWLRTPALSGSPPIAYPFVAFPPTTGVAYLDVRPILRAAPDDIALAFTGAIVRRGIFQVDAVVPDGAGEAPGLALAGLVVARFTQGTSLVAGGRRLQLLHEPTVAAALKDAAWIRFPVSIPYLLIQ